QRKQGFLFKLWCIVHLGIPALLGLSLFFAAPLRLNTQLLDLLPQKDLSKIAEVDNILTERNGREMVILFASPVFEKARNTAISFYNEFKNAADVDSASLLFDSHVIAEFVEFFYNYRFVVAGKNTIELLESGNAGEIAMDALAWTFGAFSYTPLDNIDTDPFRLTERRMREFLSSSLLAGGNIGIKQDVLSVQKDGIWYVILRMTLSSQAVSVSNIANSIVGEIYSAAALIKETVPGLELFFSGVPFHSYESASRAQREISILAAISMVFILLLFFIIFRSPIPVIFSILDVLISLVLATTAVFLFFREVHVFTFIFGTTLIGICVDYSIHFFIQWKGNAALKNGYEIRSSISKRLIMCFVTTTICFIAILFAPFPIFRQFSVFTLVGLISSFLTAYCIYPLLKLPDEHKRYFRFLHGKRKSIPPVFRVIFVSVLVVISIIILFFNPQGMKIKNDLNSLYTMSPFLEESEKLAAMVLGHGSSPWYFIVSGSSAEETLKNEEWLTLRLEEEIARGNLSSFLGTSMFVPSLERQKRTYKAMSALLPLAGVQYENLGFPREYEKIFYAAFAEGNKFLRPEDVTLWAEVSNLWIGEINGYYYSFVFPFHPKDSGVFKSIADEHDFVFLINKAEDIHRNLDILTRTIVLLFFIAYFMIAVIIFIVYPLKESIKLCITPVLTVLAVLAVLAVKNIPLGFLPIAALILVFGLGLDFMFFMAGSKNGKEKKLVRLAVFLTLLASVLSFGLLTFTSFLAISIFGFTVAAGVTAAFIFTMLLHGMVDA
ncbi:MAG: MMPL family transporter, partial [Spirochaetes bacterium]|nr:MMPL family transporter [Spirochaetota bacterium]